MSHPAHEYDVCPVCGERKRVVARTCRNCRGFGQGLARPVAQVRPDLDPFWLAEFRGLFWGEGSAMIVPNGQWFGPVLAIGLRIDDLPLLQDVHAHLGGNLLQRSLSRRNPLHGDQAQWRVTRVPQVLIICEHLLEAPLLPARKVQDVQAVFSFCMWRMSIGFWWSDAAKAEGLRRMQELRQSRVLDCQGAG